MNNSFCDITAADVTVTLVISLCEDPFLATAVVPLLVLRVFFELFFAFQEVQREHYEEYFLPLLSAEGYDGVYKQKTTEIFAAGSGHKRGGRFTMDGCATFYLRDKIKLVDSVGLEFSGLVKAACAVQLSRHRTQGAAKRLLKDNVALLLLLEFKENKEHNINTNTDMNPNDLKDHDQGRLLLVANTHVAASPDSTDCKIWQTQTLMGCVLGFRDY